MSFAQKGEIIKTEDGRRVFLKSDYTWEYIDGQDSILHTSTAQKLPQPMSENVCMLEVDYTEPKLDSKIQSILNRGRASIKYVKKRVAKDANCDVHDVLLLSFVERKEKAVYNFCANGIRVTYKRIGNTITKKLDLF